MRLEEYIIKRKVEDGINEFDREKRAENTKICVNYIFEYFNNYLDTKAGDEKTVLHDEKVEKYAHMVERYSEEIQEWLVDIYSSYGKYLHRTLPTYIKDPFFLIYDSEAEFRSLSYDVYPKLIKRYKFLEGQAEMVFQFLKDEHRLQSQGQYGEYINPPHITDGIDEWIAKTYRKYGVNMYAFCYDYLREFTYNPDGWPKGHKKRSQYYEKFYELAMKKPKEYLHMIYDYDYKQKSYLFGLDLLYRKIPKKSFIKGKKQEIEAVLLYQYCHDWEEAEQYWEEYQEKIL